MQLVLRSWSIMIYQNLQLFIVEEDDVKFIPEVISFQLSFAAMCSLQRLKEHFALIFISFDWVVRSILSCVWHMCWVNAGEPLCRWLDSIHQDQPAGLFFPSAGLFILLKYGRCYHTASVNPLWYFVLSIALQQGCGHSGEKRSDTDGVTFWNRKQAAVPSLRVFMLMVVLIKGLCVDRKIPLSMETGFQLKVCLWPLMSLTNLKWSYVNEEFSV